MTKKLPIIALMVVLAGIMLAACGGTANTPDEGAAEIECPDPEPCPECEECPAPVVDNVPFEEAWATSPHADATAEAFRHWDEDEPQEIGTSCAMCHSTPGYLDFLGADGTEAGVVDNAAPIGTVIECEACHNSATASLTSVTFPSGMEVTDLGADARCMTCHQGRASGATVDAALAELGLVEDLDTPTADLRFVNIHYYAAAATRFGSEVQGGYEYAGNSYQIQFEHVEGYETCAECHSPHTLEVRVESCAMCHTDVMSAEDLMNIRMQGSLADYDGDGDTSEGIYYEIEGLQAKLLEAIYAYSAEVAMQPVVYDVSSYPYFFNDDGNGVVDEGEAVRDNGFSSFTGRMLQAAYNYQLSLKDPGAYAHNAKYVIQLLYDSIASLNEVLANPVDISGASRVDPGHFDATAEAFRHWDEDGEVSGGCSKCHTAEGIPLLVAEGVSITQEPSNSLTCHTCHTFEEGIGVLQVATATFPSGAELGFEDTDNNLCLNCHQGRNSSVGISALIARVGVGSDVVSEDIAARSANPHYFAAGATLFGGEAQGAFQYEGKTYVGRFEHVASADTCTECHSVHALELNTEDCSSCHGTAVLEDIRLPDGEPIDFDGDGDVEEGIAGEIETMHEALYAAIQDYAATTLEASIVYDASSYPYWLVDEDGDGVGDGQYANWSPRLLRAAYNYTWVVKDPGAFAHNSDYIMQVLYDTLQDVGGSAAVAGMTRP